MARALPGLRNVAAGRKTFYAIAAQLEGKLDVYQTQTVRGGRAITLVGCTETTFIVRNSLGTAWGGRASLTRSSPMQQDVVTEAYGCRAVTFVVPEEIEAYAAAHTTPAGDFLDELAAETRATLPSPQMLTGEIEGRLLEFLVFLTGARRVLEIGTYSGYSALSMARALPPDGTIDTLELEPKHAEFASGWIDRTAWAERITIHVGPAERALERLPGPYDLVFIDADKSGYATYYEAALERLAPRGLIVVDNVLWSGRVLEEGDDETDDTRALREFNAQVVQDERVVCVMLTIRDGVTLIRRR